MLADFISRFANNKRAAAVCYLLPFVLLPVKLALLPVGPILLLIVAVLAPQTSHLRFHAIQAIVLSIVCIAGLGLVYLFGRFGVDPEGGFVSALIHIGAWLSLSGGILLAFFVISGILFFKTWQGKMVQLSWLGEWAGAVSEGDYSVLKWVVVLLGIVVVLQMSNHYKTEFKYSNAYGTSNKEVVFSESILYGRV